MIVAAKRSSSPQRSSEMVRVEATPAPVRVRPPLFLRLAPLIRHLIRENERTPSPPITPFNRSWNIQSETRACRNEGKLRVRVHGPPVQKCV